MNSMNLAWSSDYSTGISIIDEQHKRLFDYFAEIEEGIARADSQGLELVVHGLIHYAISHNTYEESLMEQAGYPMLEAHRATHESFKARAQDLLKKLEDGEAPAKVAAKARIFIGLWLISHVKHEDQDYVPYVKKLARKSLMSSLLDRLFG